MIFKYLETRCMIQWHACFAFFFQINKGQAKFEYLQGRTHLCIWTRCWKHAEGEHFDQNCYMQIEMDVYINNWGKNLWQLYVAVFMNANFLPSPLWLLNLSSNLGCIEGSPHGFLSSDECSGRGLPLWVCHSQRRLSYLPAANFKMRTCPWIKMEIDERSPRRNSSLGWDTRLCILRDAPTCWG